MALCWSNVCHSSRCHLASCPTPQVDVSSVAPDPMSTAEAVGSEEGAQVVAASEATPVATHAAASEVSGNLAAATVSEKALAASVDEVVTDSDDSAVDVETTEQEKTDDEEADMTGEAAVVATAAAVLVSGAIDTATERCTAIGAPVSTVGVEDSTPSVSVGVATAENEVSATLDDVQVQVEPVAPEEESGPERSVSASDELAGEEGAAVPGAVEAGETGAGDALAIDGEQAVEELVGDGEATAEVDTECFASDGTCGSSEGAGSAEAVATRLSSSVVNEAPEVEAPVSLVENASAHAVSVVRPRNHITRSCIFCLDKVR